MGECPVVASVVSCWKEQTEVMNQLRQAKEDLNQVKGDAQAIMRKAEKAVQQAVRADEQAREATKKQVIAEWAAKQVARLAKKKRLEADVRNKDAMSRRKIAEQWKTRANELKVAVRVIMAAHLAKHNAYEKARIKMIGGFARRSRSRGITRSTVSTQASVFQPPVPAKQMPAKRPHRMT